MYDLQLNVVEQETTAYPEGTIIGQSRAAGSPLTKGSKLQVTVAKRPTQTQETPKETTKPTTPAEQKEPVKNGVCDKSVVGDPDCETE